LKQQLQVRLTQGLTLTPQLRQAIRLLQLSTVELEAEIDLAIESNPLLERLDEGEFEAQEDDGDQRDPSDHEEADPATPSESEIDTLLDIPDWAREEHGGSGDGDAPIEERNLPLPEAELDLHGHLMWQLNLTTMPELDHAIAVALIDAIDEDGYLREPLQDLARALQPEYRPGLEQIEAVLHRIQHFDPPGVAARSLSECLLLQLAQRPDPPHGELAQRIARDHLEPLARSGPEQLAHQIGQPLDFVLAAVDLLRSLDPRPGAAYSRAASEYITPDAHAVREAGTWRAVLAPGTRPRLGINQHYESLIGTAGKADASYLRTQLQEARWLIRSLETRADTVLRVAACIVRHQRDFLEYGAEAMRPLVLREIANELELHESTISRVTTRKYLHTPRGTFEFKHFFSSAIATADGGSASSTAIQAMLRRLVDAENPRKPLSDAALVKALEREGVTVARRTVAKYREALHIPASHERKGLE
jgi:RNA polymerase sigma-54 factor